MSKTTLTLDAQDAALVAEALEFYTRVAGIGQLEEALHPWRLHDYVSSDKLEKAQKLIDDLKFTLLGLHPNASFAIRNGQVSQKAKRAYEIYSQMRHKKFVADGGVERLSWSVHATPPSPVTNKKAPDVKVG